MIVVVDICKRLHPVVNLHIRRGITELKSEKNKLQSKGVLVYACVQIYEFQYYTLPVEYLIE